MVRRRKRVIRRSPNRHFETCAACGYRGGFHGYFDPLKSPKGNVRMGLECPMCGQKYDLGLILGTKR